MSNEYYSGGSEIDLRKELEGFLGGGTGEIPKQQKFVLRQIRLINNKPIECSCVSPLTKEPDTDDQCPFCIGEGYFFDETWIYGYKRQFDGRASLINQFINFPPGMISIETKVFFLRYTVDIGRYDKIIELALDSSGAPIRPYKRKYIFRPETIVPLRSDNGRTEFLAVYCNEMDGLRK